MILCNNIKNKILLYIPEKKCPVCRTKINKLLNNKFCSFICLVRFEVGLIAFFIFFFIIYN